MAHEETVKELMDVFKIADKHVIGEIMAHKGIWTAGVSASNNAKKALDNLDLEKGDGWYRVKGCESEYHEHSEELTRAISKIIKLGLEAVIIREKKLDNGLIPDAVVLLKKDGKFLCFILEICVNEPPDYLRNKVNVWLHDENSKRILSDLFGTEIKEVDIVVSGMEAENTFEFNSYMEALNG